MRTRARIYLAVGLLVAGPMHLAAGRSSGQGAGPFEFRAVAFGADEWENTKRLNDLAADGWEYVGPLGSGMVAFRRAGGFATREVRRIEWPGNHIFFTGFSPDGRLYLGGGDTGTLRIWDVGSGEQRAELPTAVGFFTPDGKAVIGYNRQTISVYDPAIGQEVRAWDAAEEIVGLAVSPDGKRVVTGHSDKVIRLWDAASGRELRRFEGHTEVAGPSFSPDGKQILSASVDRTVRLWDAATGEPIRTFDVFKDVTSIEGTDLILQAYFLPGGKQIAGFVWGNDKTLAVWDATTGKTVRQIDLGPDFVKDLAISPDGRWLLTCHEDRTVRLRDMETGKEFQRFVMEGINTPRAPAFSPDGRFAVAGSHWGWIYLWQLRR